MGCELPAPEPPPSEPDDLAAYRLWHLYARPNIPWSGWSQLISELDEQLVALDPDYKLDQVKEKFGGRGFQRARRANASSAV